MGLRVVLSGRFKDILGAFGGRFDGEIAVGVSADDTVDHVVIVIGMMVKLDNLTHARLARQCDSRRVAAMPAAAPGFHTPSQCDGRRG